MEAVFILGAGFSKRHGGPLLREMLDQAVPANREAINVTLREGPVSGLFLIGFCV